jgi:hypothetical protein
MKERRKYPRYSLIGSILIKIEKKEIMATCYDISAGGISFFSIEKVIKGNIYEIKGNDISLPLVKGKIIWSNIIKDYPGMMRHSMEFLSRLTDQELGAIIK